VTDVLNTEIAPEDIKRVIKQFLTDRLQTKLEEVAEDDSERRSALLTTYTPKTWIADATRRVGQIQQVTHAIKYTHPDARGTSLYSRGNPQATDSEIGTHTLNAELAADVVGNAAALDVYKFLNLRVGERSILELAVADNAALAEAFSESDDEAKSWMAAFATLAQAKGETATHKLARQVYWPLGDGHYHLLAPLFPTSQVHVVWKTVQEDRFSNEAKAAREARKAGVAHPHGFREYPELAIQNFGGTKPQNISQLNSERRGENYLLPALPPTWQSPAIRPPFAVNSVFDRIFGNRPRVRELVRTLRFFLESVAHHNNVHIREKRAELSAYLCDEAVLYAAELHDAVETDALKAGWTQDARCQLNRAEQLWLDPLRRHLDADFARDYESDEWPDEICRRFGNWLNARLTTKELPMSVVEAEHWHSELEKEMRILHRELVDHE
jgi:CRISPR-associated protein Csy1